MKAVIHITGIIGRDTTLLDVIRQYKSFKGSTEVEVNINSIGGFVEAGQAIYSYLRGLEKPITTIAEKAYSIAATIFMAGDERKVIEGKNRIMIHMPWGSVEGNSESFEAAAKELKQLEKEFIDFYSIYLTNTPKETIQSLLKSETFLSGDEAFDIGLATTKLIPLKACAMLENPKENNNKIMNKTEKFLAAISSFLKNEEKEIKAELVLQDSTGSEIIFPDVEAGAEPQIGDKAVDNEGQAIDGERVSPEGEVWVFEAGELKEIKPVEEEEMQEEQPEEEIDMEAILNELALSISAKLKEDFTKENDALKSEITALKKLVGSTDVEIQAQAQNTNTKKSNQNYLTNILKG